MNISQHNRWNINWEILKWNNSDDKEYGKEPDEIIAISKNMMLIGGVCEMLKLLSGIGGTPYNSENTRIFVGSNATEENFYQPGILSLNGNFAVAKLDEGYPFVKENYLFYQASFGNDSANFTWNEISLTNGELGNSIALNRKVESLGIKEKGTWTIRVSISITDGKIVD